MLPSPRLILMVLAAAPLFLAGAVYEPLVALGVLYCAILLLYTALDALLLPRARRFTITRIVPGRVSLGVPTEIELRVANHTRRRCRVELAEDMPENVDADDDRAVLHVDPGRESTASYRLTARRRGRYVLANLDVRVLPDGGLLCRQFRQQAESEIHVYPNLTNVDRYELQLRRGLTHEQGLARLRQIGQGSEFESLRRYAWGDDMSRVDWKATAKRARLIVRNYQPERQQSVLVALDVGRATVGEFAGMSRLDYFINATLMLAYVALRQGDWFSLVAFSDRIERYLPPVRHARSVDRVARVLYELEPRLVEADYAAACRFLGLRQRKRSLVCLMTDVVDREANMTVIDYLARFAHRHLPLAVTLTDPEVRAIAEEPLSAGPDPYTKAVALDVMVAREEALVAMRRRGVGVLDVPPPELTTELINRYLRIKAARRL